MTLLSLRLVSIIFDAVDQDVTSSFQGGGGATSRLIFCFFPICWLIDFGGRRSISSGRTSMLKLLETSCLFLISGSLRLELSLDFILERLKYRVLMDWVTFCFPSCKGQCGIHNHIVLCNAILQGIILWNV